MRTEAIDDKELKRSDLYSMLAEQEAEIQTLSRRNQQLSEQLALHEALREMEAKAE